MPRKTQFKARDKVTHKISRDGLVEVNETKGEQRRVSQRGQDFNLQDGRKGAVSVEARQTASEYDIPAPGRTRQAQTSRPENPIPESGETYSQVGEKFEHGADARPMDYPHGEPDTGRKPNIAARPGISERPEHSGTSHSLRVGYRNMRSNTDHAGDSAPKLDVPKNGKLQFSPDDMPPEPISNKLSQAKHKAERTEAKLDAARGKLPVKRKVRLNTEFDADKNKVTRKLRIEKEVKSQRAHLKGSLPLRPAKYGANAAIGYAHKKMYEVENENVGTKAAHRTELAAEGLTRSALRFQKTRPYRRVAKLEHKAAKARIKLAYRQALEDNPELKRSLLSRFLQKQKIKRQYAKAAREARKAVQRTKKGGDLIGKAIKAVAGFVKRHPVLCLILLLLALLVVFIMAAFSSCSNLAGSGLSAVVMSSYLAEDVDVDNAELAYTEWESDLQIQIGNAEADYPGYDEYRYEVDDIGHNPFELMAYLTAAYQNFTFSQVQAILRGIFDEQYTLEFIPEVEIRYRTETHTDPDTGESYEVQIPYEWHILNIKLTALSFDEVIAPRMDATKQEMYRVYMETLGNRQYILNPFKFDWLPYVTTYYGWRIHPETGVKDYHKGIDIAVPIGTDVLAGHDGRVVSAGSAGEYGLVVVLEDDKGLVSKYAHCSSLLVSVGQEVKKGEVIAKSGNSGNSTIPHLHLEVIKNGQYLNPLFFAEGARNSAAPGTPGGPDIPGYSGAPLGDGSYDALIAAAEVHLGKPYVFGAKGPNSFDCSGFVCAALRESGIKSISTNAQGIYNACTPVSLENAQPGDLLFFQGTYSTSNKVTHVAIYCGGNVMLHAGKPVQYTTFDTRYWQNHFFAVGRINP